MNGLGGQDLGEVLGEGGAMNMSGIEVRAYLVCFDQ